MPSSHIRDYWNRLSIPGRCVRAWRAWQAERGTLEVLPQKVCTHVTPFNHKAMGANTIMGLTFVTEPSTAAKTSTSTKKKKKKKKKKTGGGAGAPAAEEGDTGADTAPTGQSGGLEGNTDSGATEKQAEQEQHGSGGAISSSKGGGDEGTPSGDSTGGAPSGT